MSVTSCGVVGIRGKMAKLTSQITSRMFAGDHSNSDTLYALWWLGMRDSYMAFYVNEEGKHVVQITCDDFEVVSDNFVDAVKRLIAATEKISGKAN